MDRKSKIKLANEYNSTYCKKPNDFEYSYNYYSNLLVQSPNAFLNYLTLRENDKNAFIPINSFNSITPIKMKKLIFDDTDNNEKMKTKEP